MLILINIVSIYNPISMFYPHYFPFINNIVTTYTLYTAYALPTAAGSIPMVNAYYMNSLYQQAAATPLSGPIPAPGTAPTNFLSPTSLISPTYNQYQYPTTASASNPMTAPLALLTNQTIKVPPLTINHPFIIITCSNKSDDILISIHKTTEYLLKNRLSHS